ncbi:MAG: RNA 3'-terminal phosphate cyclase [Candidatus Woesearchaeota archaeon]
MPDVTLDGSYLEGGGQIVRTAIALSTLTGKSFSISGIRKGRPEAGLKAQHLYCVKAAAKLCNADFSDVEIGSVSMAFFPKKLRATKLDIDIGTAGSISLFLQSVIIPSMFANAPVRMSITGGTDVMWSMPIDYVRYVFIPQLERYAKIDIAVLRRGYYPKGGGKVEIEIKPKFRISDFENFEEFHKYLREQREKLMFEEQGTLLQIKGVSHASKILWNSKVAERQAEVAKMFLKKLMCPVNVDCEYSDTYSAGSVITLWAIFSKEADNLKNPIILGADAFGERGKSSENVGKEAAENLLKEILSGAPIDQHLADNIIPFLGLFGGKVKVSKITNHVLSNIYVAEKFLEVKFEIDQEKNIIKC